MEITILFIGKSTFSKSSIPMGFWVGVKLLLVVKLKIDGIVIYG